MQGNVEKQVKTSSRKVQTTLKVKPKHFGRPLVAVCNLGR